MSKKNKNFRNEEHDAKKKYGQNFLEDKELLDKIIESSQLSKDIDVIEIGPGLGFLTQALVENSKTVVAFEIDNDLIPILNQKFGMKETFKLVHTDFLEYDLQELLDNKSNVKVVANIPYYITSPIIRKLIEHRDKISEIYLMVQKEVAERIASKHNSSNMSILAHSVQFYGEAEYLFTVSKEMFSPVPKVDSAFLKISLYDDERYEKQVEEEKYFKYLKAAFSNKRKSIANNLSSLGYKKDIVGNILEELNKTKLARTEEFSVQEFINLIEKLEDK